MRRWDSARREVMVSGERKLGMCRKPFLWKEASCSGVSSRGAVMVVMFEGGVFVDAEGEREGEG